MSKQKKSILAGTIVLVGFVVILGVISSKTDPQPGFAQAAPAPAPDVSIVFVIDGSRSLVGPEGLRYFSLAKEGVAEFLSRPNFPLDSTFEVSLVQFTRRTAPRYKQGRHYILPTQITTTNVNTIIGQVEQLARSTHATASLLEMGLWEAKKVWEVGGGSNADANTDKHIILLTSGEYQLPKPAPPEKYTCGDNCPFECNGSTDNRACQIRKIAKKAREDGIFVSSLQVGPEWHRGDETPYPGTPGNFNYCSSPDLPDRGELLKDVSNFEGDCPQSYDQTVGGFFRINPLECNGCGIPDFVPGTEYDIADAVGWTICKAAAAGGNYVDNADTDFLYGDTNIPLHRICDNCPDLPNKRQRDCNRDGYGDACQFTTTHCGTGIGDTDDSDDDGLCDGLDTCPNGDDCLVTMWAERAVCPSGDCSCDCDHDGLPDECVAAVDFEAEHLILPLDDVNDADGNGVPDFCEDESTEGQCLGLPKRCMLDYPIGNPPSYLEDFEGTEWPAPAQPVIHPDSGDNALGWYISDTDHKPEFTVDSFQENDGCGINNGQFIRLAGGGPASSWYVESPGIGLPEWECDGSDSECHPPADGWGAYALDMDIYIPSLAEAGMEFDIYVMESCSSTVFDGARMHLRIIDTREGIAGWCSGNGEDWDLGEIYIKDLAQDCPQYPGFLHLRDIQTGSWATLSFLFNDAKKFYTDNNTCQSQPGTPDAGLKIDDNNNNCSGRFFDGPFLRRNPAATFTPNGIKVRIGTKGVSDLLIDNMRIREIDACEAKGNSCGMQDCICEDGGSNWRWGCN
jgi:hypothetical protein